MYQGGKSGFQHLLNVVRTVQSLSCFGTTLTNLHQVSGIHQVEGVTQKTAKVFPKTVKYNSSNCLSAKHHEMGHFVRLFQFFTGPSIPMRRSPRTTRGRPGPPNAVSQTDADFLSLRSCHSLYKQVTFKCLGYKLRPCRLPRKECKHSTVVGANSETDFIIYSRPPSSSV